MKAFCVILVLMMLMDAGLACMTNEDCSFNGDCDSLGECRCHDGFVTFYEFDYSDINSTIAECNYKQKDGLIAFVLALFLPEVGASYFYLEDIAMGVGQLVYFIPGICVVVCIVMALMKADLNTGNWGGTCCGACFVVLWVIGFIIWWAYAWVSMATGSALDLNGVPCTSIF